MRWFVVLGTLLAVAAADAQACHRGGGRGGLFGRRRQADACCESVSMVSYAPAAAPCCPDSGVYPGRIAPHAVPPPAEAAPPPAASQLAPAPTPPPPANR